jgi:hypothetical protein
LKNIIYDKLNLGVVAVLDDSEKIDIEKIAKANGKTSESFNQIKTKFDRFKLEYNAEGNVIAIELIESLPEPSTQQGIFVQLLDDINILKMQVQELTDKLDAISNGAE